MAADRVGHANVGLVAHPTDDSSDETVGSRPGLRGSRIGRSVKRAVDLTVAGCALFVLSPLWLAVSVLIRVHMGRPILFSQTRPGLYGQPFKVFKFRTMVTEAESRSGAPLSDAERTTRLGYLLRQLSLDELPQLLSVLRGDMSLVGPRPLLMNYLDKYSPEQARRHEVRPGITGWAQVNGRQAVRFSERFKLDVWYIDNWSLRLDAKILLLTVLKVFRSDGVITGQDVLDVDDVGFNAR